MMEVDLRKSDSRITTYTLWSETVPVESPVLCLGDVLSDPDGEALFLTLGTAPQTHAEPAPRPVSTRGHPESRSQYGALWRGLRRRQGVTRYRPRAG